MADFVDPNQFPKNSNAAKKPHPERVRNEKVIKGRAIQRKKPLGSRISELFVVEDADSVGSYLVLDVLIPAAKNLIADMVGEGIQRMLFGDSSGYSRSRNSGPSRGYTSYSSIGKPSYKSSEPRNLSPRSRATHNFGDIILPTRGEAEQVLDRMFGMLDQYDLVTVADLYDFVGITSEYTDNDWGWTELRGLVKIHRARDGYLLDLPKPSPIK